LDLALLPPLSTSHTEIKNKREGREVAIIAGYLGGGDFNDSKKLCLSYLYLLLFTGCSVVKEQYKYPVCKYSKFVPTKVDNTCQEKLHTRQVDSQSNIEITKRVLSKQKERPKNQ